MLHLSHKLHLSQLSHVASVNSIRASIYQQYCSVIWWSRHHFKNWWQIMMQLWHLMHVYLCFNSYGIKNSIFRKNEDTFHVGQWMIQWISYAAPIFYFNSDVSLAAYQKSTNGQPSWTWFLVHCSLTLLHNTNVINARGVGTLTSPHLCAKEREELFLEANNNDGKWASYSGHQG